VWFKRYSPVNWIFCLRMRNHTNEVNTDWKLYFTHDKGLSKVPLLFLNKVFYLTKTNDWYRSNWLFFSNWSLSFLFAPPSLTIDFYLWLHYVKYIYIFENSLIWKVHAWCMISKISSAFTPFSIWTRIRKFSRKKSERWTQKTTKILFLFWLDFSSVWYIFISFWVFSDT